MKRKIISLLTALCMISLVTVPAGASDTTENGTDLSVTKLVEEMIAQYPLTERIEDAESGNIDENVREEIKEAVTFSISDGHEDSAMTTDNLMEDETSNIAYSIQNLGEVVVNGQSVGTLYSATGTEKTKTGSDTMMGVEAYMSIVWIDNFGTDNVLVEVSGGWRANGHYIDSRSLQYSATDNADIGETEFIENVSNPFKYSDINFHGLVINATSYAEIWEDEPSSSGYPIARMFRFSLTPTIFD